MSKYAARNYAASFVLLALRSLLKAEGKKRLEDEEATNNYAADRDRPHNHVSPAEAAAAAAGVVVVAAFAVRRLHAKLGRRGRGRKSWNLKI